MLRGLLLYMAAHDVIVKGCSDSKVAVDAVLAST